MKKLREAQFLAVWLFEIMQNLKLDAFNTLPFCQKENVLYNIIRKHFFLHSQQHASVLSMHTSIRSVQAFPPFIRCDSSETDCCWQTTHTQKMDEMSETKMSETKCPTVLVIGRQRRKVILPLAHHPMVLIFLAWLSPPRPSPPFQDTFSHSHYVSLLFAE